MSVLRDTDYRGKVMLLDPLEAQLHLPACLVERADGSCRQHEVVGNEHQCFAGLGIFVADVAQMFGIVFSAGRIRRGYANRAPRWHRPASSKNEGH